MQKYRVELLRVAYDDLDEVFDYNNRVSLSLSCHTEASSLVEPLCVLIERQHEEVDGLEHWS